MDRSGAEIESASEDCMHKGNRLIAVLSFPVPSCAQPVADGERTAGHR